MMVECLFWWHKSTMCIALFLSHESNRSSTICVVRTYRRRTTLDIYQSTRSLLYKDAGGSSYLQMKPFIRAYLCLFDAALRSLPSFTQMSVDWPVSSLTISATIFDSFAWVANQQFLFPLHTMPTYVLHQRAKYLVKILRETWK